MVANASADSVGFRRNDSGPVRIPDGILRRPVRRRRWLFVCLILVGIGLPAPSADANPLFDAWGIVQNSLAVGDDEALEQGLQRLLTAKQELGLNRVTPFAEALSEASVSREDGMGDVLLQTAKRLDPLLSGPRLRMGARAWKAGHRIRGLGEIANGIVNLLRFEETRRDLFLSAVPWVLLTLGLSILAGIVVQVVVLFRRVSVDAYILGLRLFSRLNALVFAAVVVALPLFAGLGLVWCLVYLFSLLWIYMKVGQRLAAVVCLVILMLVVPAFNLWNSIYLVPPDLKGRVTSVLTDRKADFVTVRELMELENEFGSSATFHVVAGELLRLHGDRELGRLEFEKAIIESPTSILPRLFLGAYALDDRDPWRALELLTEVIDLDPQSALGHYDLAIALDLTRRFDEGDAERQRAQELAPGPLENLGLPGVEKRVLYPRLGAGIVDALVESGSDTARFAMEYRPSVIDSLEFHPLTFVGLVGLVLGGAMLGVRQKWYSAAHECSKCGRVFRPVDKASYCEQCVSVFLKRNEVSIEQQTAKVTQVRRWELVRRFFYRIVGLVVPGGRFIIDGQVGRGILTIFAVWFPIIGGLMWAPLFLQAVEPALPVIGLSMVMVGIGSIAWVWVAAMAWGRN